MFIIEVLVKPNLKVYILACFVIPNVYFINFLIILRAILKIIGENVLFWLISAQKMSIFIYLF